jgi:hypothetical protein
MARAGLGWSVRGLAARARVGATTVVRFEGNKIAPIHSTLAALRRAFEAAGASFPDENTVSILPTDAPEIAKEPAAALSADARPAGRSKKQRDL